MRKWIDRERKEFWLIMLTIIILLSFAIWASQFNQDPIFELKEGTNINP